MPPQALDRPRRLADLPSPYRHQVGRHRHLDRIRAVRKIGTAQSKVGGSGPLGHGSDPVHHVNIGKVVFELVRGEGQPKRLLCVVIEMPVAMPGGAKVQITPVSEEPGAGLPGTHRAMEKIEIPIPSAFEKLVIQLDRTPRPKPGPVFQRIGGGFFQQREVGKLECIRRLGIALSVAVFHAGKERPGCRELAVQGIILGRPVSGFIPDGCGDIRTFCADSRSDAKDPRNEAIAELRSPPSRFIGDG